MALPEGFIELLDSYNSELLVGLAESLTGEPSVAVRFNRRKISAKKCAQTGRQVAWCDEGRHLDVRPAFTFDPAMHQGAYYVQDASSMFISHVIRTLTEGHSSKLRVLDACAAPGGKTTAIIDALPVGSVVIANEFVRERAAVLRENLAKWGYPYVAVTQGDTSRFRQMPAEFDIVAVDAPCSGEGMMRKDSDAVSQWSMRLIGQCADLQREIIDNVWPSLRPGGYLVYSTCTFNLREDEQMLEYICNNYGAEAIEIPIDSAWGIGGAIGCALPAYRFIPGRIEGEGLFMCVVRKPAESADEVSSTVRLGKTKKDRKASARTVVKIPPQVKDWISYEAEWSVENDRVVATLDSLGSIPVKLDVAVVKGRDFIPTQQLAMSQALNLGAFATRSVDRVTAIDYLRCEAVRLPDGTPRGIVLLTYAGLPLGFVKNLGNRANNLYPKAWRILSQRPADLPPTLLDEGE